MEEKKNSEDYDGRKIERERERSDKTATESAIRCTLHSDKVFSKTREKQVIFTARIFINGNKNSYFVVK